MNALAVELIALSLFCWSLIAGSDEYSESIDILHNQDHAKRLAAVKPRVCSILHRLSTGSATVSC